MEKEGSALYLCPGCGAFVSENASKCPKCGEPLDSTPGDDAPDRAGPGAAQPEAIQEPESRDTEPQDSEPVTLFLCSACGAFTGGDADVCPNCGASMREEEDMPSAPAIKPGEPESEILDMLVETDARESESLLDDLKRIESDEDVESFIESVQVGDPDAVLKEMPAEAVSAISEDDADLLSMLVEAGGETDASQPQHAKTEKGQEKPAEKSGRIQIDDNDTIAMCTSCGAFVSETAEVCNICGNRLKEGSRLVPGEKPAVPEAAMSSDEADSILRSVMRVSDDAELDREAGARFQSDGNLNLCTVCGAFMGQDAESCSVCGTHIEDMPEFVPSVDLAGPERETHGLALCPHCGAFLQEGAKECFSCVRPIPEGAKLASFQDEPEEDQSDRASNLLRAFLGVEKTLKLAPVKDSMFSGFDLCPDCGAFVSPQAVTCSVCGSPLFEGAEELEDIDRRMGEIEPFHCPHCNTELTPGATLCNLCGFNFAGPKEPEAAEGPGEDITDFLETELEDSIRMLEEQAEAARAAPPPSPPADEQGLMSLIVPQETYAEVAGIPDAEDEPPELREILAEIEAPAEELEDLIVPEEEPTEEPSSEPLEFISPEEPEPEVPSEPLPEDTYLEEDILEERPSAEAAEVGPRPVSHRPASWSSGVYFSLIAITFFIAAYLIMPGEYGPSLVFIFGTLLVYGLYMWLTDKGTFFKGDMRHAAAFAVGTLLALSVIIHWPMGVLTSDEGLFSQPGVDRMLLSVSILILSIGLLWIRARVRYVFAWLSGTVLLFSACMLDIAGQDAVPAGLSPAALIFGLGAVLSFLSFIMLQYEKALNTTIESDIVRGDAHYLKRDYGRALASYDDALTKVRTKDVDVLNSPLVQYDVPWYSKGSALVLMGRVEEGIKCLDMALAINPNNEVTWVTKGNAHSKLGDHETAIECFRRAIECNPFYEIAWNNLGNSHARKKQYLEALKHYNRAIKINQKYDDAWINKGYVLAKMGKRDQAVKCLEHVGARAKGQIPVMDRDVHTL